MDSARVLIVDLNNFAMYPTLSVGYLAAICREAGMEVSVFSPLSLGVKGVSRERTASRWTLLSERLNFGSAQSRFSAVRALRSWIGENLRSPLSRRHATVVSGFREHIARFQPNVVLISTYLLYRELVQELCRASRDAGVPVLVGGPYFAQPEVLEEWVQIGGMTALAAGEIELELPEIIPALARGADPTRFRGVVVPEQGGGYRGSIAPPLAGLSDLPFPDYRDFPWDRYPQRIVPVLTGRGCGWGACTFCSDVTSTAGRTFRSRAPAEVLAELKHHHERLGVDLFVFTDLKLNSNLRMWTALIDGIQAVAPGARWIASVHVGEKGENGLERERLRSAAEAGCVRLTAGLESGSQRVLDLMRKGTRIERFSKYLSEASEAGISTRCTMIAGYPGEGAGDVEASAEFVARHEAVIERVKLCNFSLIVGTAIHRQLSEAKTAAAIDGLRPRHRLAQVDFDVMKGRGNGYRRAMSNLLTAVHRVNQKPLRSRAAAFEGVM